MIFLGDPAWLSKGWTYLSTTSSFKRAKAAKDEALKMPPQLLGSPMPGLAR